MLLERLWLTIAMTLHAVSARDLDPNFLEKRTPDLTVVEFYEFGYINENASLPKYRNLAQDSLLKYLIQNGVSEVYEVVSVDKVMTKREDSSLMMTFNVLPSSCQNIPHPENINTWNVTECNDPIECHLNSYEGRKVVLVDCDPTNVTVNRVKRGARKHFGGHKDKDPNKPEYKVLAERGLSDYLYRHRIAENYYVVKMCRVQTQQLGVGINKKIDFIAGLRRRGHSEHICQRPTKGFMSCHMLTTKTKGGHFPADIIDCEHGHDHHDHGHHNHGHHKHGHHEHGHHEHGHHEHGHHKHGHHEHGHHEHGLHKHGHHEHGHHEHGHHKHGHHEHGHHEHGHHDHGRNHRHMSSEGIHAFDFFYNKINEIKKKIHH